MKDIPVIFLDHDLHRMHADNTIFKGTGKEGVVRLEMISRENSTVEVPMAMGRPKANSLDLLAILIPLTYGTEH